MADPQRRRRPDRGQTDRHAYHTANPDTISAFLNIRVADIYALQREWTALGAHFLTDPVEHPSEFRSYIRDPDGHLIEVGQSRTA